MWKSLAILLSLAGLAALSPAQSRVIRDVKYLQSDTDPKLDVYFPDLRSDDHASPAMVVIHGGGWIGGDKNDKLVVEVSQVLSQAGYVVVNIEYHLGSNVWPQCLLDCKNAVRYLRKNASLLKIDPNRIGVIGGSAGGHLSLMIALTDGVSGLEPASPYPGVSSRVMCAVDMCGPSNLLVGNRSDLPRLNKAMPEFLRAFGATSLTDPILEKASPIKYVTANCPPILNLQSEADPIVDPVEANELSAALTKANVPTKVIFQQTADHYFTLERNYNGRRLDRDLRGSVIDFLAHAMPLPGAIEGEDLALITRSGGELKAQDDFWALSGAKQLWWINPKIGDTIKLAFPVKEEGDYSVGGNFCFARNYGISKIILNGQAIEPRDFYSPQLTWKYLELGLFHLPKGNSTLEVQIVGTNPAADPLNMFGLDYLWLRKK